jgi:hypothetical protein
MAVFTSDTVEHDITRISPEEVAVFNMCTDTTRHMNGVVTNMHPSEGVWLFRSSHLAFHASRMSTHSPGIHGKSMTGV